MTKASSNLPVDYRAIVGIEARPVFSRLTNLRLQLVFVNGDSQSSIGQEAAVPVFDRRLPFMSQRAWLMPLDIAVLIGPPR